MTAPGYIRAKRRQRRTRALVAAGTCGFWFLVGFAAFTIATPPGP